MKKITTLAILTLTISACAADPTVVEVSQATDNMLSCDKLTKQIEEAHRYKTDARTEDNFKLKYMWLPTGAISAYRFNKAEGNALERINHLNSLAAQKGCTTAPRTSTILNNELKKHTMPSADAK